MTAPGVRIEKGEATDEEVAVLAVLLLLRAAGHVPGAAPHAPGTTAWRRHGFSAPNSWQG